MIEFLKDIMLVMSLVSMVFILAKSIPFFDKSKIFTFFCGGSCFATAIVCGNMAFFVTNLFLIFICGSYAVVLFIFGLAVVQSYYSSEL